MCALAHEPVKFTQIHSLYNNDENQVGK
jgi:hypothetical protein